MKRSNESGRDFLETAASHTRQFAVMEGSSLYGQGDMVDLLCQNEAQMTRGLRNSVGDFVGEGIRMRNLNHC